MTNRGDGAIDRIQLGFVRDDRRLLLELKGGRVISCIDQPGAINDFVLGFAGYVEAESGRLTIGYWADRRMSKDNAPDYRSALNVLVDGNVYRPYEEDSTFSVHSGFLKRTFVVEHDGVRISFRYRWPIWREALAKIFSDPFTFETRDFADSLCETVRFYKSLQYGDPFVPGNGTP